MVSSAVSSPIRLSFGAEDFLACAHALLSLKPIQTKGSNIYMRVRQPNRENSGRDWRCWGEKCV